MGRQNEEVWKIMDYRQKLEIAILITASLAFIALTVFSIQDIIESNKYWMKMMAELELYRNTLHKEDDILKKTQEFGEWLDTFHALMYSNSKFEDTEFNKGTLTAAADIEGKFLEIMGEYVDGKESSD